jgi:hypothetical protein
MFWIRLLRHHHETLSKALELDADARAARISGHEAILQALMRADEAEEAFELSMHGLGELSAQRIWTQDLFYHQANLNHDVSARDHTKEYAHHPSLAARTAHTHTSQSDLTQQDDTSAWSLFRSSNTLRKRMTTRLISGGQVEFVYIQCEPARVHENLETLLSSRRTLDAYSGFYGARQLRVCDLDSTHQRARECSEDWLEHEASQLFGKLFHHKLEQRAELMDEISILRRAFKYKQGACIQGERVESHHVDDALHACLEALMKFDRWIHDQDEHIVMLHLRMIEDEFTACAYKERMKFRYVLQQVFEELECLREAIDATKQTMVHATQETTRQALEELIHLMSSTLEASSEVKVPASFGSSFTHLDQLLLQGQPLLSSRALKQSQELEAIGVLFFSQCEEIYRVLWHVERESMVDLVVFQEKIVQNWSQEVLNHVS